MNKQTIARNFSRYASSYDDYADIQRRAARELADWIPLQNCRRILEIGCGTGIYSLLLRDKFRFSTICALDISDKMIQRAKDKTQDDNLNFLTADAEDFLHQGDFDLVTSNASLQWLTDLEAALARYSKMLSSKGWIYFSIFGPCTFEELAGVMCCRLKNKNIAASGFLPREEVEFVLRKNFKSPEVREEIYREDFSCLRELLEKIKHTGIRGQGFSRGDGLMGPQKLKEIERDYIERYGKITATYQVFFCRGQKG